jgi:hypothetical protein
MLCFATLDERELLEAVRRMARGLAEVRIAQARRQSPLRR